MAAHTYIIMHELFRIYIILPYSFSIVAFNPQELEKHIMHVNDYARHMIIPSRPHKLQDISGVRSVHKVCRARGEGFQEGMTICDRWVESRACDVTL